MVFLPLYGIPSDEANRRIDELSEMLGLTKHLHQKFYALSTGFRQRATIARAFVNDPKVVFLDEPTIGLDVMTALSIRDFLKVQAKEKGRTIMLATHNMAEAESICDRIAIIDRGKVIALGSPDSLKRSLGSPAQIMEVSPIPKSLDFLRSVEGVKGYTSSVDNERGLTMIQVVVADEALRRGRSNPSKSPGARCFPRGGEPRLSRRFSFLSWEEGSLRGNRRGRTNDSGDSMD